MSEESIVSSSVERHAEVYYCLQRERAAVQERIFSLAAARRQRSKHLVERKKRSTLDLSDRFDQGIFLRGGQDKSFVSHAFSGAILIQAAVSTARRTGVGRSTARNSFSGYR